MHIHTCKHLWVGLMSGCGKCRKREMCQLKISVNTITTTSTHLDVRPCPGRGLHGAAAVSAGRRPTGGIGMGMRRRSSGRHELPEGHHLRRAVGGHPLRMGGRWVAVGGVVGRRTSIGGGGSVAVVDVAGNGRGILAQVGAGVGVDTGSMRMRMRMMRRTMRRSHHTSTALAWSLGIAVRRWPSGSRGAGTTCSGNCDGGLGRSVGMGLLALLGRGRWLGGDGGGGASRTRRIRLMLLMVRRGRRRRDGPSRCGGGGCCCCCSSAGSSPGVVSRRRRPGHPRRRRGEGRARGASCVGTVALLAGVVVRHHVRRRRRRWMRMRFRRASAIIAIVAGAA